MATVQGVAVASPYGEPTQNENWTKGEKQPAKCNDPIFAAIFYIQLIAVLAVMFIYGVPAISSENANANDFIPYVKVASIVGGFAFIISGFGLLILMACAELIIKISLFFVVFMSLAWAIFGFMTGQVFLGILFLIFFLIGLCYIKMVWSRIPFATANLKTAITAVKVNLGVVLIAYFMTAVGLVWAVLWTLSLTGVLQSYCGSYEECQQNFPYGPFFGLLVSYFFTLQVVMNVIHVTSAGVVGTWWFSPEECNCCCSGAVLGSYIRSLTTSFGSICFGSLLVAIIEAIRALANTARNNDDANAILICLVDCLLACIQGFLEYFNKWAYIYVGVYGYTYLEAGKNVMSLFSNRGWEAIIADDLVSNALFLVSLVVGLVSGGVGLIVAATTDYFPNQSQANENYLCFVIGLIIGIMLCSIMLSVVGSGVNSVIVLFADAPAEFQRNHPVLSDKMRETYMAAFPGCM